ncbi:MAG TPA: AIR synthase related protein, partial [Acidimicrobiia bacterium]|nr:AIR synthase related protein [Acidimicrobiia bacterium]
GTLSVRHAGEIVAELPAASLADDAPLYDRPLRRPDWLDELWATPDPSPIDPVEALIRLLDDPGIGSSAWVHEQYDHMLFLNTLRGPGDDGSLLRIRGTTKGLAVSTDGNGGLCLLDPRRGAARLVFEAALNVATTGARPLAVVDNLNFGNPEKPEVMWQFRETVEGISEACEALGIPVVGGNVSFYNETDGLDIHPTPVVGLLGLADPIPAQLPGLDRAKSGMEIWEVGPEATGNFAGSALQRVVLGQLGGRPTAAQPDVANQVIDMAASLAHQAPVLHDISSGGLAVAITEICIASGVGAELWVEGDGRLFSEDPHRFIVVMKPGTVSLPADLARRIGGVGGDRLSMAGAAFDLDLLTSTYRDAIPRRMRG